MGNLIQWNDTPYPADFDLVKIERSETEDGVYAELASIAVTEEVYYDYSGTSTQWYKTRFFSSVEGVYTEYTDVFLGESKLYTDYQSVLRTAGLTTETLPTSITTKTIYEWITDISRNIDKATRTVYGRTETFSIIGSSANDLNSNKDWRLPYKNVVVTYVGYLDSIPDRTFREIRQHYDYEAEVSGMLHLYRYPYYGYNRYNDMKAEGSYGLLDLPTEVEQLAKIMVAIRIFVHITGGSYNDVTSYQLGEFQESLGEPYTNLDATIKMLEKERLRLQKATGVSYKRYNMRLV